MMKESYINSIGNKLKCSKAHKVEIKKDLTSDMDAALAAGETLDQIIARMGTPKEVAAKFNQNVSEEELKKYKKKKVLKIAAIVLVLVVVAASLIWFVIPKTYELGGKGSAFDETTVVEDAKQIARLVGTQDYVTIINDKSDEILQSAIDQKQLEDAYKAVGEDWGKLVSFGDYYTAEVRQMGKSYAIVVLTTSYDNVQVTFTLTYDKDMKLAGIYMK